jgi:16S rRNA (adenine1518-N6/adenine1519-N6)-dimethyltransferase
MSLRETKQLLRTYRITPNKLLGQNFMVQPSIFSKIAEYAKLGQNDVVLDAGAGFGFLTLLMANQCKRVVAVEKDPQIARALHEKVRDLDNVIVIEGDVLKATLPEFNKVVAIPPYYLSTRLLKWLLERNVDCALLILQKEFANRLGSAVGSEDYGWLTVITRYHAKVELLDEVPKTLFYPQPDVDSVIARLIPWKTKPFNVQDEDFFYRLVRWLFTKRNRKLENALIPFLESEKCINREVSQKLAAVAPYGERRVRNLSPRDFGDLAIVLAE